MTSDQARRGVSLQRVKHSSYTASNVRGGEIAVGDGSTADFTPVELLLVAIGGCTAIDVDALTSRRAEPDSFVIEVDADKIKDDQGNRLTDIVITYRLAFPAGEQGDKARAVLPDAVRHSHDRLCTVGRTVEVATPIQTRIEP